ncbi:MAG: hypothetical protein RLZZ126_1131, partial [Pseudomonadota bacterium]
MTDLRFHVRVPDRIHYTCRLLRKAVAAGARVSVRGDPDALRALDIALWSFSATDFVAHCWAHSPPPLLLASPIVLGDEQRDVVVNLGLDVVPRAAECERLIEIVSDDEHEVAAARVRWRAYKS